MDDLSKITYIGKTDFRNQMTQFGIRSKDRFRHMYVIGKSGTGKTTLLENMIVQDIYDGNGIAFIDPHGESADKILNYIPTSRIKDVIYFSPGDSEFPVAFNPLEVSENASTAERSLVADGLMTVFKKIWPDAFSGRMEYILNNCMLALLQYPDPTLLSVNRMLTDKDFRKKVIAAVTDPTVRNAWDELSKWDDKRWSEAIGALVNKIGQFTTNPVVRNIIGQPQSTFNFRQVMDEKKILIMNMSKGLIGEQSAALLGAMLITKIYLAAMSRANLTPEQLLATPPLYFYVDEFQNFANDSFANILSEARKYKLALTVANQYIAQMEETIRDAVFGNMGTTITFRLGPLDAEFVERVFSPVFTAEDLQNIGFGQVFLTLLIDGMSSKPFSAKTLGPIQPQEAPQHELVINTSRSVYARERAVVEEKIMSWFNEQRTVIKKDIGQKSGEAAPTTTYRPKAEQGFSSVKAPVNKAKDPVYEAIAEKQESTAPTDVPITLSPAINDLLSQFDEAPEQVIPKPAPITKPAVPEVRKTFAPKKEINLETPKPVQNQKPFTPRPTPVAAPVQKSTPAPQRSMFDKTKERAAKPETKNALLEALEKAKSVKQAEQSSPVAVLTEPNISLQDTLKQIMNKPVQPVVTPVANVPKPVQVVEQTIVVPPAPTVEDIIIPVLNVVSEPIIADEPLTSVLEPINISKIPSMEEFIASVPVVEKTPIIEQSIPEHASVFTEPPVPTYEPAQTDDRPHAVREVPEDILKKILE